MNDLELFKAEAIKSVANSSDYRILAIDGKAVLAEKFSTSQSPTPASADKAVLIGAIVVFGLGIATGVHWGLSANAQKIQNLQAENLILQSKIQKIRDLVD